jgi:uncharacterized protein YbjT (DUF2867 family)
VSKAGRVLVSAATGTVGSVLVRLLAKDKVCVRALSRHGAGQAAHLDGVESVSADLRDAQAVAKALVGIDRLFLATPLQEDMAAVAARVAEQACRAGVGQVVRLSAYGAGDGAATRLGSIHAQTEDHLRGLPIPAVLLRPNAFMQNTLTQFAAGKGASDELRAPQGAGRVSMIDARDIAAVAAHVLTREPPSSGCYELTGPRALSNYDIAAVLGRALGRDIRYIDTEPDETRAALRDQGFSPWLSDIVMELFELSARGAAARISADVERLLGRAPIGFERFVADYAAAFR